jgi:hypothetical protein
MGCCKCNCNCETESEELKPFYFGVENRYKAGDRFKIGQFKLKAVNHSLNCDNCDYDSIRESIADGRSAGGFCDEIDCTGLNFIIYDEEN